MHAIHFNMLTLNSKICQMCIQMKRSHISTVCLILPFNIYSIDHTFHYKLKIFIKNYKHCPNKTQLDSNSIVFKTFRKNTLANNKGAEIINLTCCTA